jgi:biopolymer transport protein TolR
MSEQDPGEQERLRKALKRAKGGNKPLHVKPAGNVNTEMNVTPLIDVVLVLLIIFMVLTPLKESDIAIVVPDSDQAEDASEVPPDQLVVYLGPTGKTKVNTQEVTTQEQLSSVLKERLTPRKPTDRLVFVVAADAVAYGRLVSVIDTAKQAGAETIGYATEAPDPALFQ